jgi:hypothetical protein
MKVGAFVLVVDATIEADFGVCRLKTSFFQDLFCEKSKFHNFPLKSATALTTLYVMRRCGRPGRTARRQFTPFAIRREVCLELPMRDSRIPKISRESNKRFQNCLLLCSRSSRTKEKSRYQFW